MINCNVYERIFKRFDEDGDGKLSPSELQWCVGTIGEELLLEEAREVVGSMDSDGDGFLGVRMFYGSMFSSPCFMAPCFLLHISWLHVFFSIFHGSMFSCSM